MRVRWLVALVVGLTVLSSIAGCGWSPPSAPPPAADKCALDDGPTTDTVAAAIAKLPNLGETKWTEDTRGNAPNCQLYWVQVVAGSGTQALQHVLFFDGNTPLGTATREARPYTIVTPSGDNSASVQYQWRQNNDPPCCPTGIGTVRFTIEDGKLTALDPIPGE